MPLLDLLEAGGLLEGDLREAELHFELSLDEILPGLALMRVDARSEAKASVIALSAVFDEE